MLPQRLEDVDKASVESLIADAVREGRFIEYKRELHDGTEDKKKEFLADVSSFANTSGGDILYGIEEQRDNGKPTGFPQAALGLAGINVDETIRQLESQMQTGIKPPVAGIRIHSIPGFPQGPVLLIRIPKSWRAPHMVTYQMRPAFHARTNTGKQPLDIADIRSAFAQSEALPQRIKDFRAERVARILADDTPVALPQGARVILHLIPFSAMDGTAVLNPIAVARGPFFRPLAATGLSTRFNVDGVVYSSEGSGGTYLQVFRTGALEAVCYSLVAVDDPTQPKRFPIGLFEMEVMQAAKENIEALKAHGVLPPIALLLTLTGVKEHQLAGNSSWPVHPLRFDRDTILFPDLLLHEELPRPSIPLRPLFDMVCQAAGLERSPSYDSSGTWRQLR
jgi:hypothetical protein